MEFMRQERCILVDVDDKPIGCASKADSHLCQHGPLLHRAFSVFLFDGEGRMLVIAEQTRKAAICSAHILIQRCSLGSRTGQLQKRAAEKITFPSAWTNTCCSHPLCTQHELGTDVSPADPLLGVKRAGECTPQPHTRRTFTNAAPAPQALAATCSHTTSHLLTDCLLHTISDTRRTPLASRPNNPRTQCSESWSTSWASTLQSSPPQQQRSQVSRGEEEVVVVVEEEGMVATA